MSKTKLRPCPFCGGKPVLLKHNDEDYYKVFCECCGARQWTFANRTDRDAIRNWNTRKPMDNIVVELEKEKCPNVTFRDKYAQGWNNGTANAIDIVKSGGVNETNII